MNGRERFPYELLVQIYDQRLQILWFAIAFLGAFYISLTYHLQITIQEIWALPLWLLC